MSVLMILEQNILGMSDVRTVKATVSLPVSICSDVLLMRVPQATRRVPVCFNSNTKLRAPLRTFVGCVLLGLDEITAVQMEYGKRTAFREVKG